MGTSASSLVRTLTLEKHCPGPRPKQVTRDCYSHRSQSRIIPEPPEWMRQETWERYPENLNAAALDHVFHTPLIPQSVPKKPSERARGMASVDLHSIYFLKRTGDSL